MRMVSKRTPSESFEDEPIRRKNMSSFLSRLAMAKPISLMILGFFLARSARASSVVLETFEGTSQANGSTFSGSADRAWLGDIAGFQIDTATWPTGAGQPPDFATSHSLRSRADSIAGVDTVVTSLDN